MKRKLSTFAVATALALGGLGLAGPAQAGPSACSFTILNGSYQVGTYAGACEKAQPKMVYRSAAGNQYTAYGSLKAGYSYTGAISSAQTKTSGQGRSLVFGTLSSWQS